MKSALGSTDRGLFRAGLLNAPTDDTLADSTIHDGIIKAPDTRLLGETFVALSSVIPSEMVGRALHATLVADKDTILADPALSDAWQIAARHHAAGVILAAASDRGAEASSMPVNLLPDPGFDSKGAGPWSLRSYAVDRPGTVELSVVAGGRSGGNALKIISPFRADAGAGVSIAVKPHTRYRLGGWVKTENLRNLGGQGAMLNVHGGTATKGLSGTSDWTELSMEFNSGNQREILVHCLFGGYGGGSGSAWFDDLYLTEIGSGDISGAIDSVVKFFTSKADPAARQALASALAGRTDEFSKNLIAGLGAAPVGVSGMVRKHKPDPVVHERGLAVFNSTCIACHGPDGKGVPGAFPPLDGSAWPVGDPSIAIRILLSGLQGPIEVSGQKFENIMPPHTDLKDDEISDVLTYVRQSWSNDATPVSTDAVRQARARFASRSTPWTAAELK